MAYTDPVDRALSELITPPIWNAEVAANFRAMGPHLIAPSPSNQNISTAFTAVTGFTLPVGASERWLLHFVMVVAQGAGNWEMRFTFPGGGEIAATAGPFNVAAGGQDFSLQALTSTSPTTAMGMLGGTGWPVPVNVTYKNGSTAGNVAMEVRSTSGSLTVRDHSSMWAVKLT